MRRNGLLASIVLVIAFAGATSPSRAVPPGERGVRGDRPAMDAPAGDAAGRRAPPAREESRFGPSGSGAGRDDGDDPATKKTPTQRRECDEQRRPPKDRFKSKPQRAGEC